MAKIHNLGFPRIGRKRELKQLLENYWEGQLNESELLEQGQALWLSNLAEQADLDWLPVGDFSFYDHVLDTSVLLGNLPERVTNVQASALERYFLAARGSAHQSGCCVTQAAEMTKWFDTNYHYIVPEISQRTQFSLHSENLLRQVSVARQQGYEVKPVVLGPLSYLHLARVLDDTDPFDLLPSLLEVYASLLQSLSAKGVEWVQLDEPLLAKDLSESWKMAFRYAYQKLAEQPVKLLLASYFGPLDDNFSLVQRLPVAGFHLDGLAGQDEVQKLAETLGASQVLSVGVVDGRNIWKADQSHLLNWLTPLHQRLENRLWLAPTCSLIHVPLDASLEDQLVPEVAGKLAFAVQKIKELVALRDALNSAKPLTGTDVTSYSSDCAYDASSHLLFDSQAKPLNRPLGFSGRYLQQQHKLQLPLLPTTTIGSFPQTRDIRQTRAQFKRGEISESCYEEFIQAQIKLCVETQEALGLDVLVHGEPERNDMVEYFAEWLDGVAVSQFGWVQSYGSRCVKPPLIHGQVSRPAAMTVKWIDYAQSFTSKPVKGMLTGPVTLLNWSFVRDDVPAYEVARQLAEAVRAEVQDLEAAGIGIIQVDEAALREGLPLRKAKQADYLTWAVNAFRLATSGVSNATQIHTHMCYSEFSDIIEAIRQMDADVITIETARSQLTLLDTFADYGYPNAIGPGVYDIHSPVCPTEQEVAERVERLAALIPAERLWINPDCGLKTRSWSQATAALQSMIRAAHACRKALQVSST